MWLIGILSVGLSIVGAGCILAATLTLRFSEPHRHLLVAGGVLLIAVGAFAPLVLIAFRG